MNEQSYPPMFFLITTGGSYEYINIAQVSRAVAVGDSLSLHLQDGSELRVKNSEDRIVILELLAKLSNTVQR